MKRTAALLFVSVFVLTAGALAQEQAKVDPDMYVKYSAASTLVGFVQDEFVVCLRSSVGVDHARDAMSPVALSHIPGFAALAASYHVSSLAPEFPGSDRGLAAVMEGGQRLAHYYKVKFSQGTLSEAMAAYEKNPAVDHVEPIGIHTLDAVPNDPSYASQWHLKQTNDHDMDAPEAWDIETGKTTVIVAMLDTGVRYFHKDLGGVNASYSNVAASRGNMWINWAEKDGAAGVDDDANGYIDDWIGYDFVNGATPCTTGEDCSTKDNDPRDFNGHGTHCAGNIAAMNNDGYATCSPSGGWGTGTLAEYGTGVKLMACRVGWSGGSGANEVGYVRTDFCAEGFYYAANNGARIASCSWGTSNTGGIADAVTYFINAGGLVFKAAGNDDTETADYMCARSDVISVAATDQNDCKASFSTYGTWVDVSAPGVSILSLYHLHTDPTNDYVATISGTSMSTPLAASVAALIWSRNPSWTAAQVRAQLQATTDNIDGLACNLAYAGKLGTGRVNAYKAVNSISITVTSPTGGEIWNVGTQHDITWTLSGVTPDSLNVYLSLDGGSSYTRTIAHGLSGSTTSYNWTVPALPVSTARVKVVAYTGGAAGGMGASLSDFTIKGAPRRYVKKTGGNVYPYSAPEWAARTITDAVSAAVSGDSIFVAEGLYASTPVMVSAKALYLYGGWDTNFVSHDPAAHVTTINCAGSNVSFMNISSGTCGVEGFTLTYGTGTAAAIPVSAAYGGAVFSYLSSPIIKHNSIVLSGYVSSTTNNIGGGIACYGGTPLIEWNTFTGCLAQSGGGIYLYQSNATIRHNVIMGSAPDPMYSGTKVGGGIYAYQSTVALENNKITQNDGYKKGGGIYVYIGSVTMSSDTVSGNDAAQNGGGMYVDRAPLTIDHALVGRNTAGSSSGGGIYYRGGTLNMTNCLFWLNSAGTLGGAVYADSTVGSVVGNTFDRGVASFAGNVYVKAAAAPLDFKNNIMTYGSEYGFGVQSAANIAYAYNNCYGNTPADYETFVPDTTNISGAPVYADTAAADYHLGVSSASIDAGDPEGAKDPDGSRADQGAYGGPAGAMAAPEYVKNLSATAVSDTTIEVVWDPTLADASYYAVYGSQTSGFAPGPATLIGTVTVPDRSLQHHPVGGCWYYRVDAVNGFGYAGGYADQAAACAAGPDTVPPTVLVAYPNGGERIYAGAAVQIKWHATDNQLVDSVSIYYTKDAGVNYVLITHGCTADSTFDWIAPAISSDSCLIKVVAYDHVKNTGYGTSDTLFSIHPETSGIGSQPAIAVTGLNQNYPNPFNPATRIVFSLNAASLVRLSIYDSAGRLVRVLVDATMSAGKHEALWDGRDRVGHAAASGVYFYRLEAGSFTQTRKMVLLR